VRDSSPKAAQDTTEVPRIQLDATAEFPYIVGSAHRGRNPCLSGCCRKGGVTGAEREDMVSIIASNPMSGDEIPGSGGYRKVRFAGKGKGKSGGYRIITFYSGKNVPIFLITVFGKGMKANLSKAEVNALSAMSKKLIGTYAKRSFL
jgi:hypothetical protein